MDVIVSVASKIAECMVAPIARNCGYVLFYKGNLERLKTEVQKLEGTKDSVQHSADEAKGKGEVIENIVKNWLNNANGTVAEAKKLVDSEDHAKVECNMSHFPNLWTRHRLSRKTVKMAQVISQVLMEGNFDRISYRAASQVTVTPFCRGYEALDSRTSTLHEIKEELKDPKIYMIGVYGMGGVGKTTLMEELAWEVEKDGSFDVVVMATVTNSPDIKKIQGRIADRLRLKFDEETKEGRAERLCQRMKTEQSILVILDDIWGKLDLTEIGIPFGDENKGCKLVLTSRDLNVLNCEMGTQKDFRLEFLLEEDSWSLFKKMAGDVVEEFSIKPIAEEVAKCCAGLPLLIVTVAKGLRKKDVSYWKSALNELKIFDQEGLRKKVYSTLELSYNCLDSDELKSLFLFIGSFGLDYLQTGGLFSYCWGLGLFRHVYTLTEGRNKYYKLINDLKASSLLLESEVELVRMHDVVRDVAKSIASKAQQTYAVERLTEIKQFPEIDQLQKCHSITLPWSYIYELPEKLECPLLKLLVLHTIGDHLKVHKNFFSGMGEVKVLDLHGMMFTPYPPPSLSLLTNLRSLKMSGCVLGDIAIVAELKSLEILSLERSDIKELPKEIGQLSSLRMLNLANCSALRVIPANLISSLTCLEELYMGNCFIQWEVEGTKSQSNNASLSELRSLYQLTTLDIMIQDASVLPRDLQVFTKLERYNIFIGDLWKWSILWSSGASESARILKLAESKSESILLNHRFNMLLNAVEDMCLARVQHVRDVLYELNKEGFPQLKHLNIQYSDELKYIINPVGQIHPYPAFPNLETLALQNLDNMEEICHGPIPMQSFAKLKKIKVKNCDKLKCLLWYSVIRDLPQLLKIKISGCKLMTQIIAEQTSEVDKEMDKIMFPKLHSLTLKCLPSLVSFCSFPLTIDIGFKERGEEHDNTQCILLALIDQKVALPQLKTLKLSMINSWKLWDDKLSVHSCIQNLKSLTIDKCGSILYVFSTLVARELINLQYLEISNCQKLTEIFVADGKLGNLALDQKLLFNEEVIFPNLETLVISHMDLLKSVWPDQLAPNSFCKLKKLETKFCNKLLNIIPSYDVLDKLKNLETIIVTNCPTMEAVFEIGASGQVGLEMQLRTVTLEDLPMLKHIWNKHACGSIRMQNLCQLKVIECKILNHVFPLSMAKELLHLQELSIEECAVENVVVQDELADIGPTLAFPQLTSLSLRSLTQLRSFYSGLHTLNCPVLRILDVFHCDKLELFMPKSLNDQKTASVDPQPLLSIEKVTPNLSELILSSKDVTMLCNGQLNDELIYTIKALRLRCFHDESNKFPSDFLQRFFNLENLKLTCSSFTEIFSTGSFGRGNSKTTKKLRNLILVALNNLEFICEDKSEMQSILENLESLYVYECSKLKNIVPSSMLVRNLEELVVGDCAALENIITPATAVNLPRLKILRIYNCEQIEEIVASDNESNVGELAFMKLEYLHLKNLPRLRSFCKGSCSFKFPLLERLHVINCHMMETFSFGLLSAPKLRQVYVKPSKEWHWSGDLNITIRKLFSETNPKDD